MTPLNKDGLRETPAPFRPWLFLLGVALGLAACAGAGHWAARHHSHPNFTRFASRISPEGNYYPTLDEMCNVVRERMTAGKILVIVGGNSIFHGVGQPADRVWTLELQRLLGERFVVVNLALRGAGIVDGGAIVSEVLRDEFPQLIYVANTSPWSLPHPAGQEPYVYLMREARARGLLADLPGRDELLADFRRRALSWSDYLQMLGVAHSDRVLRYRDLWNWVGFNWYFSVPSPLTPTGSLATVARGRIPDEELDFAEIPASVRFRPEVFEPEMRIVRGFSSTYLAANGSGGWSLRPDVAENFRAVAGAAMPDWLKRRTLVMLSRNSPHYTRQLTPEERERDELAYATSLEAWRAAGYHAQDYGRDFSPLDFGDRTHLTTAGGRKLAAVVAAELRTLGRQLNYLTNSTP